MPIDDLTALGDALRAARKEKNLTQEQLVCADGHKHPADAGTAGR